MEQYLEHHGVKGQHWGIQNGPPYPLDGSSSKKQARQYTRSLNRMDQKRAEIANDYSKQSKKVNRLESKKSKLEKKNKSDEDVKQKLKTAKSDLKKTTKTYNDYVKQMNDAIKYVEKNKDYSISEKDKIRYVDRGETWAVGLSTAAASIALASALSVAPFALPVAIAGSYTTVHAQPGTKYKVEYQSKTKKSKKSSNSLYDSGRSYSDSNRQFELNTINENNRLFMESTNYINNMNMQTMNDFTTSASMNAANSMYMW